MKKSRVVMVMAIAIIAIVAVMGVSYASWSVTDKTIEAGNVQIAVPTVMTVDYTEATDNAGKVLAPKDTIVLEGQVVQSITLGTITTGLKNAAAGKAIFAYATIVDAEGNPVALDLTIGTKAITGNTTDSAVEVGVIAEAQDVIITIANDADIAIAGKTITVNIFFVVK